MTAFKIDIITIFPGLFDSFLNETLIARAIKKKIIQIKIHDLRKWARDSHKTVDGRPYGGGAGMVLMVEPIMKAVKQLKKNSPHARVITMSAKGKQFDQEKARKFSAVKHLIIICGRYEGLDERINQFIADEEVSIGNYVLFGGEIPSMVITEAVTRLLPGAVGKEASIQNESFKKLSKEEKGVFDVFIEHPQYTRPEIIEIDGKKRRVPKVLLSGNHKLINEWQTEASKKALKKKK